MDFEFWGEHYKGWFLDGEIDYPYEDEDPVQVQPGEGLWLYSTDAKFKLQSSGEVPQSDVETSLIEGGLTLVNPTPVEVDLGNCKITGYEDVQGETQTDVVVYTLDENGSTEDASFTWMDFEFWGEHYYGWYLDGEIDYPYEDEDPVTMKPGQGIWVNSTADNFKFVWPGVKIAK